MNTSITKLTILLITAILLLGADAAMAQSFKKLKKKGDKQYENYMYSEAIDYYEQALQLEEDTITILRLADSYRLTRKMESAENWYRKAESLGAFLDIYLFHNADHLFNYAQVLKYNEKYEDAIFRFQIYEEHIRDGVGEKLMGSILKIPAFKRDSALVEITALSFNTPFADFSPVFYKSGLAFCSSRPPAKFKGSTDMWSGENYLDLYYVSNFTAGSSSEPEPFSSNINSPYHEGPATFSGGGGRIYFTRSNVVRNRQKRSKDGTLRFSIFYADWEDNREDWGYEEKFQYNSDEYSIGHPALTKSGNRIYFASDMDGGYGGFDIYYCEKEGVEWGDPINLGAMINTQGNELYPFINEAGTLFFSSDLMDGLGGLDIFSARQGKNDEWGGVRNLGYPINTSRDDFGMIMKSDMMTGYFSSNRLGGEGGDDIYMVQLVEDQLAKGVQVDPMVEGAKEVSEWEPKEGDIIAEAELEMIKAAVDTPAQEEVAVDTLTKKEEVAELYEEIWEEDAEAGKNDTGEPIVVEEVTDNGIEVVEEGGKTHNGGFDVVFSKDELEEDMKVEDELAKVREREKQWKDGDPVEGEGKEGNEKPFSSKKNKAVINGEVVTWGSLLNTDGSLKEGPMADMVSRVEVPGITYRLQVGAYTNTQWFDESRFEEYGGVETYDMNDNIVRYVIPRTFNNIGTAETFRKETLQQGIEDAFIVPFKNSKRITMNEALYLIAEEIK